MSDDLVVDQNSRIIYTRALDEIIDDPPHIAIQALDPERLTTAERNEINRLRRRKFAKPGEDIHGEDIEFHAMDSLEHRRWASSNMRVGEPPSGD